MSIDTYIRCDNCGEREWYCPPVKSHMVRGRLKKLGWKVGLPKGCDVCGECWSAMTEHERNAYKYRVGARP